MAELSIDTLNDDGRTLRAAAAFILAVSEGQADNERVSDNWTDPEATTAGDHTVETSFKKPADDESMFADDDDDLGNDHGDASTAGQDAGAATGAQPADPAADTRVDMKGVAFNPQMCANAAKPFYASGKTSGQWKKRGGASGPTQEQYDAWYAAELAKVAAAGPADDDAAVDTAAAFNAPAQTTQAAPAEGAPADVGTFMGFIAEMQAAQKLNQDQIGQAYLDAGVDVTELFPPNPPDQVAAKIAAVYANIMAVMQ